MVLDNGFVVTVAQCQDHLSYLLLQSDVARHGCDMETTNLIQELNLEENLRVMMMMNK